jgi:DNA-binding GntR family transcriptional regulator
MASLKNTTTTATVGKPADPAPSASELEDESRVREAIVEAVLSHRLPPGTRLVETPLCEAFGVSRSLLRRVLVRLASEKVVELQHNRGATVAQPTQAEVQEVFEVRRFLETGLVRRLCGCAQPAELAGLRTLVKEEQDAYARGDRPRWLRLSGQYHLASAQILKNRELEAILHTLVARTTLMTALYEAPGRNVCSFEEHAAILDAITAGDAARASALMEEHLRQAEVKLRRDQPLQEVDLLKLFAAPTPARSSSDRVKPGL